MKRDTSKKQADTTKTVGYQVLSKSAASTKKKTTSALPAVVEEKIQETYEQIFRNSSA